MKLLRLFILLLIASVAASYADDTEELMDMSLEDLLDMEVVTVSKKAQKSSDAPATIYVINENQIRNRGYFNLEELLEDIPEIEIQRNSVSEYSNYFTLRGVAGNEKFIIMLDGFRISSVTGTPHVVGTNYSLANASRVEVILGPASALYGVDAFTGIINIITKKGNELNGGKARASFGQFNTTDNAFVVGGETSGLRYSVTGQFFNTDGADFPELYEEEFSWYHDEYRPNNRVLSFAGPGADTITSPIANEEFQMPVTSYFVHANIATDEFEIGFSQNMESHSSSIGLKPEYAVYGEKARYVISNQSIYFRHNWSSDDEKVNIQSMLSRGAFQLDPESAFTNSFTGYTPGYKYETGSALRLEEQLTWNINERFNVIGGFTYEDFQALPKTGDLPEEYDPNEAADLQELYYLGTNITDAEGNDLTIFQDFYNLHFQNYGAYVQLTSRVTDFMEVTAGTRYDYNTRFDPTFNPRLGIVLKPTQKLKAKLLYGESYLAPSPYKAYQHYGSMVPQTDEQGNVTGLFAPFWNIPNPDLQPEQLRTVEANLSYSLLENLKVSVNGYFTQVEDLITNQGFFDREFKGVQVGFAQSPVNEGDLETYGGTFRIDGLFKFGQSFLNYFVAYSYSDGTLTTADGREIDTLSYSAQNTVKAGIDFVWKNLSISPRLIYRGETYHPNLFDENGDRAGSDAFALLNLFIRYSNIIDTEIIKLDLFAKVNNLTNQEYTNVFVGGVEGFTATPQNPIVVTAGLEVAF